MDKEILNSDGSRNFQANILLDNIKRLEKENEHLKKVIEYDSLCNDLQAELDYDERIIENLQVILCNLVNYISELKKHEKEEEKLYFWTKIIGMTKEQMKQYELI